ncbi:toxin [Escherichia coli]|uniref:Putative mRNA interferase YoeB n=1 Tax=Escherichia coli TaxID=562 RepID=A0A376U7C7_ECOLX|nr:toxin [Escherichia coli]
MGYYLYWQETDKRIVKKINELIKDTRRTPFEGKGKPEPLKHNLSGFWSDALQRSTVWYTGYRRFTAHCSMSLSLLNRFIHRMNCQF